MPFDTLTFVLFFAVVLAAARIVRSWSARKSLLLAASWLFYAAWSAPFVLLLAASTTWDFWLGRAIAASDHTQRRRQLLFASLIGNLGLLGLFKYHGFFAENLVSVAGWFGVSLAPPAVSLVLPVGISFYTFQSLSYTIDVYRRRVAPIHSWRDFALFVGFFPQLVAGPIVRFADFAPQLATARRPTGATLRAGLALVVLGLFEKVVLADTVFAPIADAAFGSGDISPSLARAGTLAFAGQIFCDFAGYSTCAIGAAAALGFRLPQNFRMPYAAVGFADFWRRWHISLSTWLRDYLYVPLGGSRHGRWLTLRNLMLTMLLGGLWHGAAWTFVIWGALHGGLLVAERILRRGERSRPDQSPASLLSPIGRGLLGAMTLVAVVLAWVPFRAANMGQALAIWSKLLTTESATAAQGASLSTAGWISVVAFALLVATHVVLRNQDGHAMLLRQPPWRFGVAVGLMLALIVASPGASHAFIYFQF